MTLANPTSVASTRSLRYGAFVIVANVLLATASIAALLFLVDATRLTQAALVLDGIKFLVVGGLCAAAIHSGVRGLRETADGNLRRRGWAIAGIVIGSVFGVLTAGSLVATTVLNLI
jgi:hypothetical protein